MGRPALSGARGCGPVISRDAWLSLAEPLARFGHAESLAVNKAVPVFQRTTASPRRCAAQERAEPGVMVTSVPSSAPSLCAIHGHAMAQSRNLDHARTIRIPGISTLTRGTRLLASIELAPALVLPPAASEPPRASAPPRPHVRNWSTTRCTESRWSFRPGGGETLSLTRNLEDPREVLSVGTFPLRYRETD